jgi:hypothetical protein
MTPMEDYYKDIAKKYRELKTNDDIPALQAYGEHVQQRGGSSVKRRVR